MAYTKKNTTAPSTTVKQMKTNDVKMETVNEANVGDSMEDNTEAKVSKKKFAPEDLIPCVSLTPGEMFVVGERSKTLYTFADIDHVVEIEFRDLDYAARRKDAMMYKPRYIVQDRDFIAMHPELDKIYSSLHSVRDLKAILSLAPNQMRKAIEALPVGAQDAIKTIAATMVDQGTLDSIQRVKVIDSIFNTELLLKLTAL